MALERPENSGKRRDGNTTRLVDYYVQLLFLEKEIKPFENICSDNNNINKRATKFLFDRIINRLMMEHRSLHSKIAIDKNQLIIKMI